MAASMTSFTGLTHQRQERFLGSAAPLLPARRVAASSRLSAVTPSALFTKNKNKSGSKKRAGTKGYDDAYEAPAGIPAFTRRREVFVGRLAMFGFSAALLGEILTGKGPIGQVQQELGLPSTAVELLFLGIIAYSLLGAALPGSPTYSDENQADIKKRPAGTANKPTKNIVSDPKETLGVSSFGFTRGNELFVGRTAQLGFLAAVIGEKITGVGILKQFNFETGIPVGQASIGLLAFIGFFFVAAIFTGNFTDDEDQRQF